MRQIETRLWCDVHNRQGERTPGTTHTIAVDGPPREVELCEVCAKELLGALLVVLADARPAEDPAKPVKPRREHRQGWKRTTGPFRCLVPGCVAAPLKSAATLETHVGGVHDLTLAAYVAEHGQLVALTPAELAALVIEARCEVVGCGKVYSTALGNRKPHQALLSHMRGHHKDHDWRPRDLSA